jgi:hypothetical protein
MRVNVFGTLHNLNDGFERVINDLKRLRGVNELKHDSVQGFVLQAEELRAGVNRFVAQEIHASAEADHTKFEKLRLAADGELHELKPKKKS